MNEIITLPLVKTNRSQKRVKHRGCRRSSHPNIQAAAVITRNSLAAESLSFRLIEVIAESHVISSDSIQRPPEKTLNSIQFTS